MGAQPYTIDDFVPQYPVRHVRALYLSSMSPHWQVYCGGFKEYSGAENDYADWLAHMAELRFRAVAGAPTTKNPTGETCGGGRVGETDAIWERLEEGGEDSGGAASY